MSTRPGIVVKAENPADGGASPNQYPPVVTTEIRVFWPPLATEEQVLQTMAEATLDAIRAVVAKRREG